MKKDWILFAIIAVLSCGIIYLFRTDKTVDFQDIIEKYEIQIDSLQNINRIYTIDVDSLNKVINKNDSTIKYLATHIDLLQQNRKIIEKKYKDENKKLNEMRNDSIVIYLRDYLRLWKEQK